MSDEPTPEETEEEETTEEVVELPDHDEGDVPEE